MNFNKQNKNEINVNTRGYRFMNKNGFCPSTLVCGYWNEMISLKIHPALPESKQTQSQIYDYNQMIATSLSLEKAIILIKKTKEIIYPAIENNQKSSIAVLVGGVNLVQIGYNPEVKATYIGIHKGLDPETKKPQDSLYYEFINSSEITIQDYDAETGKEVLKGIINIENGDYLGEVALVDKTSPIFESNTIFYETLYDENASCHLALGQGFTECIRTEKTLKDIGFNDSLTHVDFMIGTEDLDIIAETEQGKIKIMENGKFVI